MAKIECINSSKVYCKFSSVPSSFSPSKVLIVAKCIVNTIWKYPCVGLLRVLIVAKCIVNQDVIDLNVSGLDGINSSKVYCKCIFWFFRLIILFSINSSKVYCKSLYSDI